MPPSAPCLQLAFYYLSSAGHASEAAGMWAILRQVNGSNIRMCGSRLAVTDSQPMPVRLPTTCSCIWKLMVLIFVPMLRCRIPDGLIRLLRPTWVPSVCRKAITHFGLYLKRQEFLWIG